MPGLWTIDEAFQQPELPDPSIRLTPPAPNTPPYDVTILEDVLYLASAICTFSPAASVITVGNLFNLIGSLLTASELDASTEAAIDDAATRAYLTFLQANLTGLQNAVSTLSRIDPVADNATYMSELISLNTTLTTMLPGFMNQQYQRISVTLFMSAAVIHLNVLRCLVDASPAPTTQVWASDLQAQSLSYAAWLRAAIAAISSQRLSEVGDLTSSFATYIKNVFYDYRLVAGGANWIDASPATTAPQLRTAYLARREMVFNSSDWMQNLQSYVTSWQQAGKLCAQSSPGQFAPAPQGAVFPGIGTGGSYVDIAEKLAWSGPNMLQILFGGVWTSLVVPSGGQSAATVNVGGTPTAPTFSVDGDAFGRIGPVIQPSQVWAGTPAGTGMIVLQPVSLQCTIVELSMLLYDRDGGDAGQPLVVVYDAATDEDGNLVLTAAQSSSVIGFSNIYTVQGLPLLTPLPAQPGQYVGWVNSGPNVLSLNWIDGPGGVDIWWNASASLGWSTTIPVSGTGKVPCVSSGWSVATLPAPSVSP